MSWLDNSNIDKSITQELIDAFSSISSSIPAVVSTSSNNNSSSSNNSNNSTGGIASNSISFCNPRIKELDISTYFSPNLIAQLAKLLPNVRRLTLTDPSFDPFKKPRAMAKAIRRFANLEELVFNNTIYNLPLFILELGLHLPALKKLRVFARPASKDLGITLKKFISSTINPNLDIDLI